MMINFRQIQRELLKELRGKQSQSQLAKKLGFKGNQPYRWEKGLQSIGWEDFVVLCKLKKVSLREALREHLQFHDDPLDLKKLFPKLVPVEATQAEIARIAGVSRLTVSRWKKGEAVPDLVQILMLINEYRMALLEFLDSLIPGHVLPTLARVSAVRTAEKSVTYRMPYASAVIRALELAEYHSMERHIPGWIATRVGITAAEEESVLRVLSRTGAVRKSRGKYRPAQKKIDTRGNADGLRQIRAYWTKRSLERINLSSGTDRNERFGHNVYSVSRAAQEKLDQEYFRFFERTRAIINEDTDPATEVYVLQVQIFRLGGTSAEEPGKFHPSCGGADGVE